jgi:hypothetical protein
MRKARSSDNRHGNKKVTLCFRGWEGSHLLEEREKIRHDDAHERSLKNFRIEHSPSPYERRRTLPLGIIIHIQIFLQSFVPALHQYTGIIDDNSVGQITKAFCEEPVNIVLCSSHNDIRTIFTSSIRHVASRVSWKGCYLSY